jgi:hypothetical protein
LFGFGGQHAAGDLGHVGFGCGHGEMIVAKSANWRSEDEGKLAGTCLINGLSSKGRSPSRPRMN